jgi:hypothetical protein
LYPMITRRSTDGRSRITACHSERRTGIGSRGLVPKRSHLSLSPSHIFLADGDPDEENIAACGVGRSKHYLGTIHLPTAAPAGFYSLFSVTEDPWVSSGGTPTSLSGICHGSTPTNQENG